MITKFRKKFSLKKLKQDENFYKFWGSLVLVLGITAALVQLKSPQDPIPEDKSEIPHADTFIPKGFTLVPIEVANYESLDSIIGQYGVVDLFTTPLNPQEKSQRIAYSVKILRAPRNPSHFAVLMPESQAHKIAGHIGQLTVTVRNPKETGTKFVQEKKSKKRRQVYYDLE